MFDSNFVVLHRGHFSSDTLLFPMSNHFSFCISHRQHLSQKQFYYTIIDLIVLNFLFIYLFIFGVVRVSSAAYHWLVTHLTRNGRKNTTGGPDLRIMPRVMIYPITNRQVSMTRSNLLKQRFKIHFTFFIGIKNEVTVH